MAQHRKYIYLDIVGRTHSLYTSLIKYPPTGYYFLHRDNYWDKLSEKIARTSSLDYFYGKVNRVIPVNMMKSFFDVMNHIPKKVELVYSSGHLVFRDKPWLVDLEFVTHLAGYNMTHFQRYNKIIKSSLQSKLCKKILPWTKMGARTIKLAIDDQAIHDKVETVHLAVPPKKFIKSYDSKKIRLLFVGSQNLVHDFEIKGGTEVLEAFSRIVKNYDNVELVMRSFIPPYLRKKYNKTKNLRIIDSIIPWQQLDQEFRNSDIFLFPSHNTPGLAILDAMSYELPVITTDLWANSEMIQNERNGLLIAPPKEISYYNADLIPKWGDPGFLSILRKNPLDIEPLIAAICRLIDNPNLRKKMGREGRNDIETGEFSILNRNAHLKKILDDVL